MRSPFFMWNFEYGGMLGGLWTGAGEAEALGELFFDNLATLLSVTDLMLGLFLNVKIRLTVGNTIGWDYAGVITDHYTKLYLCARAPRARCPRARVARARAPRPPPTKRVSAAFRTRAASA